MIKRLILFLFVSFITACDGEPNSTISDKLLELSPHEAQEVLLNEVGSLHKWILKQQGKYDSTHSYIFQNVLFKDLYKNPYKHYPHTKNLLGRSEVEFGIKKLLIKTSLCLDLKDYLSLGGLVTDTGDNELMTVFLSPGAEYGNILSENYSNPLVVKFLSLVVEKYPAVKDTANFISSGSYLKQTNEYREFGEKLPVLSCSKSPK